jgi:aminopeptidase N
MASLTNTEARRRADLLTVDGYAVDLDLTLGDDVFGSTTGIRFRARATSEPTFLDVKAHQVRSALLNGRPLDVSTLREGRLPLPGLAADNELVVDTLMAYSHDGEGLHRHVDPEDGNAYLYAMSFLDAAPRWFACFDQPDLKAPLTLSVRCPPGWTVAGNGAARCTGPGRWELATTSPLSTYFTTLIAGPYHSIRAEHDGIPLALHARASLAEHLDRDAEELLTITRDCLDEFHRLFGVRYPWGEYHQAFVPEFNAGAMENPGCVTFRDPLVFRSRATDAERGQRASTIAHEMAHMWFGDLVTMRWWDDLWLNESFAEYLGQRVCATVTDHAAWTEFGVVRKAWGYAADRRPSTHPVAGNGAADAASALNDFDGISYAKGASVLRQLATYLGDDVFFAGLRRYFATHAYANATFDDLLGAWTAEGAHDLARWAGQWLRTSGLDTLHVDGDGARARVRRDPAAGSDAAREHAIAVAGYDGSGREIARVRTVLRTATTEVALGRVAFALPDAADETWAKVSLDSGAWRTVPAILPALEAPARVVVWNALRLAVADAELDPARAVDVVAVLAEETDDAIVTSVLRWADRTLLGTYLPDDARRAAAERLSGVTQRIVGNAPDGSSRQLAGVRGWIAVATDASLLHGWLRGVDVPPGLVMDAELRWSVLERLSALGALGVAELDAEAERDRSSQGAVHAAACRALRPDADAKAVAWQRMMTDPDCSNYELYALANGFWHPSQRGLTAPYVERYFAEVPSLSSVRSGWVLARLAEYAYPWTCVDAAAVEHTRQLLARTDLDAGVRRSVVDAGDDLRRALASRLRFGG